MVNTLRDFFGIVGLDITAPTNISELFPYILTVTLGFALVGGIFSLFKEMVLFITNPRKFF